MNIKAEKLHYAETGVFSKLAIDFVSGASALRSFYRYTPGWQAMEEAVQARLQFDTNRIELVAGWKQVYASFDMSALQQQNMELLLLPNSYTITTAHQPNIFTGPLYFIYKILHAIRLAEEMKQRMPAHHFVPVYYMGSEDADLDELGHFFIDGEKWNWDTPQTGAVGRMNTKGLEKFVDRLQGRFAHLPFGADMVALCHKAYVEHSTVQEATFYLVNELFKSFGLLVLVPDNARFKKLFTPVIQRELAGGFSQPLVDATVEKLEAAGYKIQVKGRPINLFYLDENGQRERIEKLGDKWVVEALGLSFNESEIMQLAADRPELFSANVILRGLFQETLLPNIAFIGGGGELAYWIELKSIFEAANVPYPVLVLRNSFMLLNEKHQHIRKRAGLKTADLFLPELTLKDMLADRLEMAALDEATEARKLFEVYKSWQEKAGANDPTLQPFVAALHTKALQGLHSLQAKMQRARRRKLGDTGRQIELLKASLFPGNGLQERVDNFMPYYAAYGPSIMQWLYEHSDGLNMQFTVIDLPVKS